MAHKIYKSDRRFSISWVPTDSVFAKLTDVQARSKPDAIKAFEALGLNVDRLHVVSVHGGFRD